SAADTSAGFHYTFDCAGGLLSATYATAGASASTSCSYADGPSTHTVSGRILDKDGGYTDYSTLVTVNNVAPTVTAPADQSANEGASTSFGLGSFSDPGVNDIPWTVDVDWGDGSPHTAFTMGSQGPITAQNHTYDDNGNYTVTVTVTDKDLDGGSASFHMAVHNVAPTATPSNNRPVNEARPATVSFSAPFDAFSDAGVNDNPWAVDVDWGDASPHTTFSAATQGALGMKSHTYADNGSYTVTVKVTDKDLGYDSKTFTVTVNNLPPVVTAPANQS